MWDPFQYALFSEQRSRPFYDLFGRIRETAARNVVDLGCGSGELTRLFARLWQGARVVGVDSSPEMLSIAGSYAIPGRLSFVEADIGLWTSAEPVDLLFSNAALQWLPDHASLIPRLAAMVAVHGRFAVQMPRNHDSPQHCAIAEVAASARWRPFNLPRRESPVRPAAWYAELLLELGFAVDAWETEYLHILPGESGVLEWLKGTALRPILSHLKDPGDQAAFLADLDVRLREISPPGPHGTMFPFRRTFFVATRQP